LSTYAVGDIQGCFKALQCVLEQVDFNPGADKLWVAGDLVNRGPESLETLRFIKELGDHATVVLGNHDLHFLAIAHDVTYARRKDTVNGILEAADAPTLVEWLRQQPLFHWDNDIGYCMVHAGIPPQWSMEQTLSYASEVETVLRGDNYQDYLAAMYGDEPALWNPALTGLTRMRVITNYLTRMRFCDPQGTLDLQNKGTPDAAPAGFKPWFAYDRKTSDTRILFGHWASLEGKTNVDNVYALDTGCVWGGKLSVMRLEDQQLFHCDCEQ
jgi:bis(5'-nucleosyl)-tetraphosphatase (symmetrical)